MIIPLSILSAGVWLNSLAVFASAVFKHDITLTLWVTGVVVLVIHYSVAHGAGGERFCHVGGGDYFNCLRGGGAV